MKSRKEPAKVWRDGDLIKILPVNSDNVHFLDYTAEMFDIVDGVRWMEINGGYLRGYVYDKVVSIHHVVLTQKDGYLVDHTNRNKCDNTRANLRHVTRSQSGINRNKQRSNTSGIVGVTWEKRFSKWYARIRVNGERIFLGYHDTIEDAAQAYRAAEDRYYPNIRYEEAQ